MKSLFLMLISLLCVMLAILSAQSVNDTRGKLTIIANTILNDAAFRYVDDNTGIQYTETNTVPKGARLRPISPFTDWRYWNGVVNIAMLRLSDLQPNPAYEEFVRKNIAFGFNSFNYFETHYHNEGRWNYPFAQLFLMEELDDCGAMGASVIEIYKKDKQQRYKDYIDRAANHILNNQSRLNDGALVRSFPHKWTLWADDLFMGLAFLSRMGEMTGETRYFDNAAMQVINFHKYLFNQDKGLMYHCWYSDVNRPGVAFWGRANGWAMVAQVELLDRLPKNYPQRDTLIDLLQRQIIGISRYQSANGLWHQLLDKTDSYLETSCSAMFTYTIARAVNKGYIEPRYSSIALQGWEGVLLKIRPDGQIEGVCAGTGTSDDLVHYYTRPTPLNDIHGIGLILLAGTEILQLTLKNTEK